MNPLIVIPSYWTDGGQPGQADELGERGAYDYATPISKPLPELESCLSSLEQVRGVLRVAVLVVADQSCYEAARARVNSICRSHPNLNPLVVGREEGKRIVDAVSKVVPSANGEVAGLRGYGAIKNLGLAVASVFGHDVAVFIYDDELVLDPDFLTSAVFGLGAYTRQDLKILAKSGFYIDENDSPYAKTAKRWTEKEWTKTAQFNKVMERAQKAKNRITRSNHMCGGCCAIHAEAFTRIPFDPYITRGDDLDYVLNLRSHGVDAWFDNQWCVRQVVPEETASTASVFMQNIYRWLYEYRKLDVLNSRRDLRTITLESLMPYPAPWLSAGVEKRILHTALRRLVAGPRRRDYLRILTKGRREADQFARENASRYLSFSMAWPGVIAAIWDDRFLQKAILRTGEVCGRAALGKKPAAASEPLSGIALKVADFDDTGSAGALAAQAAPADPGSTGALAAQAAPAAAPADPGSTGAM
ncbi:hypothetical protein [Paratractidigestivibacter sp.]|uniref:hypothetical protein n=1 Tax=Paratractidigestivibacter sp. TaxID=2847316 RepID=UPI002ABE46CF|nr:hypothetical protein [Paratractidigestivibacter sp.]